MGKKVVLVYPIDKWVLMLLAGGAKVRNLGDVRWLSTEDRKAGKGTGRHIAAFILTGLFSLLLLTGCMNKLPVVAKYQQSATNACLAPKLEIKPAVYVLEDNGLMEPIACDPPMPKGSSIGCFEKSKSWTLHCDDPRTIDLLPHIENTFLFDYGKAKERGDKFWCVIVAAGHTKEQCKPLAYPSCDPSERTCR